jgi:UDP:flavonoid glycosyltransferase YjiC (YdhE family)
VRILVTSTKGSGHFGPLVPVIDSLAAQGSQVRLAVPPALADRARQTGHPVEVGAEPSPEVEQIWDRVRAAPRREAAVLVNREIFGRLDTAALLPAVETACRQWRPDLVVHEAAEFAGPVAAHRAGLPHLQVAIGLAEIEAGSLALAAPALARYGPDVETAVRASRYLTGLPASLDPSPYPATLRFRDGASVSGRLLEAGPPIDAPAGRPDPLVYISFGSVVGRLPIGATLYRATMDAVADLPVRAVLTTGRARDVADLGPIPPSVRVEDWVDQDAVLAQASLVVGHGGAGTTFGALRHGVPLVVLPVMADQPTNGLLVQRAGAGLVVDTASLSRNGSDAGEVARTAAAVRGAISTVLGGSNYRRSAARVAVEMREQPPLADVIGQILGGLGELDGRPVG